MSNKEAAPQIIRDDLYWSRLLKKKFKHDKELSKLDLTSIVKKYTPYVYSKLDWVSRYAKNIGSILDEEDIFALGQEGILKSIEGYKPETGTPFFSYAAPKIEFYMKKEVERSAPMKVGAVLNGNKVRKAISILKMSGIDKPKEEQISQSTGLSLDVVKKTLEMLDIRMDSLDKEFFPGDEDSESLESRAYDKADQLNEARMKAYKEGEERFNLALKVSNLTDLQSKILRAQMIDGKTLEEIAQEEGLSEGSISKHVYNAKRRIEANTHPSDDGRRIIFKYHKDSLN